MKRGWVVFGLVLATLGVLGAAALVPEVGGGHSAAHPRFPSMAYGGSGFERHGGILWLGWAFGVFQILLYAALMAFGGSKRGSLRGLGYPLLLSTAAYLAVWSWLVLSYRSYMSGAGRSLFLAFPAPTALLVYGLWPLTLLFTLCFVLGFKRWVLSDEDYAEYQRLLAARQRRLGGGAGEAGGPGPPAAGAG
ncbi:MAG: hypothetical protein V3U98_10520 [Acidobacteriota bacterium]